MQVFNKHYFKTFLSTISIFFLLGIPIKFFFEITLSIAMHFRLAFVFTKHLCNVILIPPELHHNEALAEVLQQEPKENAYDEEIFHGTKVEKNLFRFFDLVI
ncbi:hypothetical protein [Chitinophaga sp. MM2321]|uniref:hypothetical protein n=1 Tax=Chitinophaga sp. MM2321 TaxID=3137178 RepID=UPI0032D59433